MRRIETLADCIGFLNDVQNPDSEAYQLRNPGLVRAFSFKHLLDTDEQGRRRFGTLAGGYRFLVQDLELKCGGKSRAKGLRQDNGKKKRLKPHSTLPDLLASFNIRNPAKIFEAVDFLQRALKDENISDETPLSFFLEENANGSD